MTEEEIEAMETLAAHTLDAAKCGVIMLAEIADELLGAPRWRWIKTRVLRYRYSKLASGVRRNLAIHADAKRLASGAD